jgi:hypothetical protein
MGIDIHSLNFLRYAYHKSAFGDTLTLGRQSLCGIGEILKNEFKDDDINKDVYCERLLETYFSASSVDSIDNSSFENATLIHDLNKPIPDSLRDRYQTIIDGGCLEHIFNIPQALRNISSMLRCNGQVLHITVANNFCGHGFYQFSPDFFLSIYSKENGFEQTEIFIADLKNNYDWYKVSKPVNGKRINLYSSNPLYILVRSVKAGDQLNSPSVQQTDYQFLWNKSTLEEEFLKTNAILELNSECLIYEKLSFLDKFLLNFGGLVRTRNLSNLSDKHPYLEKVKAC